MYAYNAALWCDDCAEKITDKLDKAGHEDTGDTNEYPQWYSDSEESDCPQHCDGCGEFLENSLTSYGEDYVKEHVDDDEEAGITDSVVVTVWKPFYDYIDYGNWGECAECGEYDRRDCFDLCSECE